MSILGNADGKLYLWDGCVSNAENIMTGNVI
jgi:hypothetical protein